MTWEEVRELDRARTVAVLPVGAVEAHGPHLPLATDVVIAEAMAREGARRLEARDAPAIVLPALAYTPASFAASFSGTLGLSGATLTGVVVDLAAALGRHGFRALAIANAHLDPDHLAALHEAVDAASKDERAVRIVFPDLTRRPWGARLTDEFRSGACHAGRFEGSVVLAERPDLVRESVAEKLPAVPRSLSKAVREGHRSFEEAGAPRAYTGAPAEATAEEGRETVATLGEIVADAVIAALEGEAT